MHTTHTRPYCSEEKKPVTLEMKCWHVRPWREKGPNKRTKAGSAPAPLAALYRGACGTLVGAAEDRPLL